MVSLQQLSSINMYFHWYLTTRYRLTGYIPLPESFAKTDELLRKYLKMKKRITSRGGNQIKSNELWKDYYDVILSVGPAWKKSRVLNGLPEEEEKIPIIMREGGSRKQHYNRSIADVAWLEQNGTN